MKICVPSRRIVALLAAYVIALQAVLLPLSVVAHAAVDQTLCSMPADGSQQPAHHDGGCPCGAGCGMQCCGQALAAPPQAVTWLTPAFVRRVAPPPAFAPIVRIAARGPQVPRGPPAA
jgi:hypothetical protein